MEKKWKERIKSIIIIVLLIIIAVLLMRGCFVEDGETAIISENKEVELKDNSSGEIRIKVNPSVDVKDGIMENLNFCNYNENRLLKIKIKVGETYVYESDFIQPGEVLEKDFLENEKIKIDGSEAIGEVYSYTIDKELVSQTNVLLELNDNEE